jgi:hypothetical protein
MYNFSEELFGTAAFVCQNMAHAKKKTYIIFVKQFWGAPEQEDGAPLTCRYAFYNNTH